MNVAGIRTTLKLGSIVFGGSSIFLFLFPGQFIDLLGLQNTAELEWSMRMIGITVFALAGNMWQNSLQADSKRIRRVALVMAVSAFLLGLVTLMLPAKITWFTVVYSVTGFGFSALYIFNLLRKGKVRT